MAAAELRSGAPQLSSTYEDRRTTMRTEQTTSRRNITSPNFAAVSRKPKLADLIHNRSVTKAAAEAAITELSRVEDKNRDASGAFIRPKTPKVSGGMTEAVTVIVGDKRNEHPASEWFFTN